MRSTIAPFVTHAIGLAPTALALSPDGTTLYVALGGVNAVAIYQLGIDAARHDLSRNDSHRWYPSTLDVSPDGRFLADRHAARRRLGNRQRTVGMTGRYVHAVRGAVNVVEFPTAGQLAAFTVAVSQNNRLPLATSATRAQPWRARGVAPRAVPERTGEPSLIKHVVYIINENRTYDQMLGDLGRGDGDTSLVMYGRDVTPNTHALAEQFVTLDRFFASGGNSADGHQWLTQANETEYTLWPLYEGRSYPYDGTDPLAYSNGGFIWDAAAARHQQRRGLRRVRAGEERLGAAGRDASPRGYRAVARAARVARCRRSTPRRRFRRSTACWCATFRRGRSTFPMWCVPTSSWQHLARWQQRDQMPNLVILQLPSNHTAGTRPAGARPRRVLPTTTSRWARSSTG